MGRNYIRSIVIYQAQQKICKNYKNSKQWNSKCKRLLVRKEQKQLLRSKLWNRLIHLDKRIIGFPRRGHMLLRNNLNRMEVKGRVGVGEAITLYRIIRSPHWLTSIVAPVSDPFQCMLRRFSIIAATQFTHGFIPNSKLHNCTARENVFIV